MRMTRSSSTSTGVLPYEMSETKTCILERIPSMRQCRRQHRGPKMCPIFAFVICYSTHTASLHHCSGVEAVLMLGARLV